MQIEPWMIVTWAAVSAALVAVMVYRATLTQHETDQLFLNDEAAVSASQMEHNHILEQVNRIRPICQGLTGATLVMSAMIATIYVVGVWPQISFRLH